MNNINLFESILLKEGYKENDNDRKRFNSITRQQIEDRLDCTILSGPHDDKTGPCYCVDDHDHEVHILYMQDILNAFKGQNEVAVAVIDSKTFEENWGGVLEDDDEVFDYISENGKNHIVAVIGKRAEGFIDEVIEQEDEVSGNEKSFLIAVSRSIDQRINKPYPVYDLYDIVYDDLESFVDQKQITIPEDVFADNEYALKGISPNTVFTRT